MFGKFCKVLIKLEVPSKHHLIFQGLLLPIWPRSISNTLSWKTLHIAGTELAIFCVFLLFFPPCCLTVSQFVKVQASKIIACTIVAVVRCARRIHQRFTIPIFLLVHPGSKSQTRHGWKIFKKGWQDPTQSWLFSESEKKETLPALMSPNGL